MKIYKTHRAIKAEYRLRFIFACFMIFSLYSLGSWYTENLKRSMTDAFTESISDLAQISDAFKQAEEMTLEITKRKVLK